MSTITTRSGKGSPLTNNEVDSNFTNLNTDKAELSGATFTGEIVANGGIALGDNDKATFGAGDDLQIFHDGTQSLISEVGTGNLSINGTSINFNNNDLGGRYAEFVSNGAVNLFHAGDKKLATTSTGIDVTGRAVVDGLTSTGITDNASSTALTIDSAQRLNIGKSAAVTGNPVEIQANSAGGALGIYGRASDNFSYLGFYANGANTEYASLRASSSNDLTIKTGGANRLVINSTGIDVTGTATMDGLTVDGSTSTLKSGSSASALIVKNAGDSQGTVQFGSTNNYKLQGGSDYVGFNLLANGTAIAKFATGGDISFYEDTGTTPKMVWDASAEFLGIGTGTQTINGESLRLVNGLYLNGEGTKDVPTIGLGDTNSGFFGSTYVAVTTQGQERFRVDTNGNVGIGTDSPSEKLHIQGDGADILLTDTAGGQTAKLGATGSNNGLLELNNSAHVGTVFLNSSGDSYLNGGNVLVGTTSDLTDAYLQGGGVGIALRSNDQLAVSRSGSTVAQFNRNTNDGDIVSFRKDGLTVGSIGAGSDELIIGTADTGLRFYDGGDAIIPRSTSNGQRNGTTDLGASNALFKDLYLSGTAIANSGFQVGTTGIGNINNVANDVVIYSSSAGHNGLRFHANGILPTNNTGALIDADADIGFSSYRFKDAYLSGGVYLGGTSDANKLDDYEEGTWTPYLESGTGITYTSQAGRYRKVGNITTCTVELVISNSDSDGSVVAVGGLPFVTSSFEETCVATLGRYTDFLGAKATAISNVRFTGSAVLLMQGSNTGIQYNQIASSGTLQISFTYISA